MSCAVRTRLPHCYAIGNCFESIIFKRSHEYKQHQWRPENGQQAHSTRRPAHFLVYNQRQWTRCYSKLIWPHSIRPERDDKQHGTSIVGIFRILGASKFHFTTFVWNPRKQKQNSGSHWSPNICLVYPGLSGLEGYEQMKIWVFGTTWPHIQLLLEVGSIDP